VKSDRFTVITSLTNKNYRDLVRGMTRAAWPEFMLHEPVANQLWHELLDRFPEYQLALYDRDENRVAAMGNSFPLRWEGALDELPEDGWDWAFKEAVSHHKRGVVPDHHCAIQVVIHPDYRSQGLSVPVLEAVSALTETKGHKALIIPVRPSEKSRYPLASLDEYITWQTDDGLPFDAWLRVHVRLGGKIIKVCHHSKKVRGTMTEWEKWTGLKFPQSGPYVIPGALNPIDMDIENDEGIYIEPNVWMVHEVS
jgi:GNAT superfamily N-acetyltransferase